MKPLLLTTLFLLAGIFSAAARTNYVTVGTNGSFTPQRVDIFSGDTVVWLFPARNDNIVPVNFDPSPSVLCTNFRAYVATDTNEFAGPMPRAVSGIFTLSQEDAPFATLDSTWQSTNITGAFIRMRWDAVHLGTNNFNWADMDRESDKAVANGKVYSLGFKAGYEGTPAWIFSSVSNDLPVLLPACTRLVMLHGGAVVFDGPPARLRDATTCVFKRAASCWSRYCTTAAVVARAVSLPRRAL